MKIRPLRERILAELLGLEERVSAGGIILKADNGKDHGIRPRWALIKYVGDGIDWVKPGDYVLVAHGRWTRALEIEDDEGKKLKVVRLDNDEILAVHTGVPEEL
jgi:co-chaperonin GroES (HSP10)